MKNEEIKKNSLVKSIHEAAASLAEGYIEYQYENIEDIGPEHLLSDGRIDPTWLDDAYCDQLSESLYGDSQADCICLDKDLFTESDFEGVYSKGNVWNVLDKYVSIDDVNIIFSEEWDKALEERYGSNWREIR